MCYYRKLVFISVLVFTVLGYAEDEADGSLEELSVSAKLLELKTSLESSPAREITFEEERAFPFRKKPIVLTGILRQWNGVGVSIEYPKKRTIIVTDEQGVLMRKFSKKGKLREKVGDVDKSGTMVLFKALFEFDYEVLNELFVLEWIEENGQWSIAMSPLEEVSEKMEKVTMSGSSGDIEHIDLKFVGKKNIKIYVKGEERKDSFTEDERTKYFRNTID